MSTDANGNFSLPPSYFVQTGDTILPVQHNPPFESVAQGLTNRVMKDGRTVMTGDLQMGGNKVTNVAPGTNDGDALNVLQLRDRVDASADFATVADMLADNSQRIGYAGSGARIIVAPGQIIAAQGFRYEVVASDATGLGVWETVGGVRFRAINHVTVNDFDNSNPMFIAHRNQAQLYPDQSIGAFWASAASPYVHALECDVRELSDGTLVCFHDSTVDRVTSSTGNVEDLDADGFRALYLDSEIWHGSNVADGHQVAFFEDVLREFKGKKLFAIEIKTSGAGQAVIDALEAAGIPADQAIVASFSLSDLTPVVSAGFPAMLATTDTDDIAAAQSAGVTWVTIRQSASDTVFEDWIAAGFKTVGYTVDRRYDRDRLLALGVIGFYTDDVEYLARNTPMATRDTYATGLWMPGMLAIGDSLSARARGRLFPNGSWGWPEAAPDDAVRDYVLQGWAGPMANDPAATTASITFNVKYGERASSARWVSVYITDESVSDREVRDDGTDTYANGYSVLLSASGNLTIYRVDDGDATQIAAEVTGLSRPNGTDCRYRVTVTPTEIIVEQLNPDGSVLFDVSVTDSTYRGGYFHIGRRQIEAQISGVEISFGEAPAYAQSGQSLTGQVGNAHVVRHADGTQECWGKVVITPVANTPTDETVAFPLPFIDNNYSVSVTAGVVSSVYLRASYSNPTTTTVDIVALRTNTTTTEHSWYARGRWK